MHFAVKLIVGGWTTTIALFVLFALHESGKFIAIRKQLILLAEFLILILRVPEEILESQPKS
jgi:hypothetical protein